MVPAVDAAKIALIGQGKIRLYRTSQRSAAAAIPRTALVCESNRFQFTAGSPWRAWASAAGSPPVWQVLKPRAAPQHQASLRA